MDDLEFIQVHFKAPDISGEPNVAKESLEFQKALDEFETEVKAQCASLESAVSEIDKLQEVCNEMSLHLWN
jgi:hypothetical protein